MSPDDEFRMLDEQVREQATSFVADVVGRTLDRAQLHGAPQVSALGACLCASFTRNIVTDTCKVCGHESHASRVHCGVMVNA